MSAGRTGRRFRRIFVLILLLAALPAAAFLVWTSVYYHAQDMAGAALVSDEVVRVEKTDTGWLFDGPSEREALPDLRPRRRGERSDGGTTGQDLPGRSREQCFCRGDPGTGSINGYNDRNSGK